ncbi:NAD(P)/FAD-dependent oxidoreductase [Planctobacterium marinum]|uniref:Oxidoreductase n=1 Tax=Planctobacterium marinum TaxID=1631968 RepID=A0AA48HE91_9ALTE|nr:oxidoreductase [Planctobacterium marinum]
MYDPLIDNATASGDAYPDSYWTESLKAAPKFPSLQQDESYDVVIIGAGFTGMACARYLSANSNLNIALIDANQPGWGCSGRNAGFILPGSGRLDYTSLSAKYGQAQAATTLDEYYQAIDTLQELKEYAGAQCDVSSGGYLKIGHSQQAFERLRSASEQLPDAYKSQYKVVSAEEIRTRFIPDYPSFGGVFRTAGQALNPLKLSVAIAQRLAKDGIPIYADSAIEAILANNDGYQLETPQGVLQAKKVVMASNAYSLKSLLPGLTEKQFPVLSSVLVTTPLPESIAKQWRAHLMAMDTRSLKYYFRLLDDNRILFGGRGAVTGADANTQASQKKLKAAFDRYFPALTTLSTERFWSGWISVSADDIPHALESEQHPGIYYATGYCGSGLSFSCQAGKRLADMICKPESALNSPVYQKQIPAFPFSSMRRTGLTLFYAWHRILEHITMKGGQK